MLRIEMRIIMVDDNMWFLEIVGLWQYFVTLENPQICKKMHLQKGR